MVLALEVQVLLSLPCKNSNHSLLVSNELEHISESVSFRRYGSTKCGLRQFHGSIVKESQKTNVGLHTASPGMVLTELLLSGSSIKNKQMFNIICELPETVARTLVPRMRVVKGSGKAVNYLTPPRILLAIVTSWLRRGRWFDDQVSVTLEF
jgi:NAD(P)-dependent dehydrogenase (short-subunit alcohol dehydrogenase family)